MFPICQANEDDQHSTLLSSVQQLESALLLCIKTLEFRERERERDVFYEHLIKRVRVIKLSSSLRQSALLKRSHLIAYITATSETINWNLSKAQFSSDAGSAKEYI